MGDILDFGMTRQMRLMDRLDDVHSMLTQILCVGEMAMSTPEVLPNPVEYLKQVREAFRAYDTAAQTHHKEEGRWAAHRRSLDNVIEALEELGEKYNKDEVLELTRRKGD